jgi:hypothetical protein
MPDRHAAKDGRIDHTTDGTGDGIKARAGLRARGAGTNPGLTPGGGADSNGGVGGRDWVEWHHDYDVPGSSLARRLEVVRELLRRAIRAGRGPRQLVSLCAGDGRDVLPVLASEPGGGDIRALLVEADPVLAGRARLAAAGRPGIDVRTGDAGDTRLYQDVAPADLLLACGVFGNISTDDMRRTIAALPGLLAPHAIVIWTRGRGDNGKYHDPSQEVRAEFRAAGFAEMDFVAPDDQRFRVGMSRYNGAKRAKSRGTLFSFIT